MTLLCRVEIRSDRIDITLSRGRLTELLAGSIDLTMQHQAPTNAPSDVLRSTVRRNYKKPIGLAMVRRELGEELIVGDARRCGQAGVCMDLRPNPLSDFGRRDDSLHIIGHIEIGLIE